MAEETNLKLEAQTEIKAKPPPHQSAYVRKISKCCNQFGGALQPFL